MRQLRIPIQCGAGGVRCGPVLCACRCNCAIITNVKYVLVRKLSIFDAYDSPSYNLGVHVKHWPLTAKCQMPTLGWNHGPLTFCSAICSTTLWCASVALAHHKFHELFLVQGKLEDKAISFSICTANPAPPVIWKVLQSITLVSHAAGGMPQS